VNEEPKAGPDGQIAPTLYGGLGLMKNHKEMEHCRMEQVPGEVILIGDARAVG
jgi:hypothetical protein